MRRRWLVWDLDPALAASGLHEIKVVLVNGRDPRIRPPLGVANVEIWTSFGRVC